MVDIEDVCIFILKVIRELIGMFFLLLGYCSPARIIRKLLWGGDFFDHRAPFSTQLFWTAMDVLSWGGIFFIALKVFESSK